MSNTKKERIQSLTGIKVICVLLIFLWHTNSPKPYIDLGARACEILFVISGFLTAYNHFQDNFSLKNTLLSVGKRYSKLLPLHLTTMVVSLFLYKNKNTIITVILNLLLLHSWSNDENVFFSFNGVSWFLSSLLFCYAIAPYLNKILKKAKNIYVFFLLTMIIRFFVEYINDILAFGINMHVNPFVRMLEFFLGMELFYIQKSKIEKNNISIFYYSLMEIIVSIIYVGFCRVFNGLLPRSLFVFVSCFLVFIFSFNKGIFSKMLSIKPILIFNEIQLEFFMWHVLVLKFYNVTLKNGGWFLIALLGFATTTIISICCYYLNKKIINKKINIYFAKLSDSLTTK